LLCAARGPVPQVANNTDANWVTAPTYRPVTGIPRGVDWLPQLYGGYIHPDSTFGGGITIIVSNWNTSTGNPYQASQYCIWGILPTVRTGDPEVDGLQATEATKAMLMDEHKTKRHVKCWIMISISSIATMLGDNLCDGVRLGRNETMMPTAAGA